jgi:hypothetical protein
MNTARYRLASADTAQTFVIAFGGVENPPNSAKTESWNGTSWTERADLSTARHALGGTGIGSSALAVGGEPPSAPDTNATEEWTAPLANKTITAS